ncbi:conserved hypothetical protein [Streptomyces lividans TK24]|nr:conserved hypothetical protein [Streptomyces lividans TK24]
MPDGLCGRGRVLRLLERHVVDHSANHGRGPPSAVVSGPVEECGGGLRRFQENVGEIGQSPVQRGTNGVGVLPSPPARGPFGEFVHDGLRSEYVERVGLCEAFPRQGCGSAPCQFVEGHGGVASQRPEVGGTQVVDRLLDAAGGGVRGGRYVGVQEAGAYFGGRTHVARLQ